MSLAALKSLLLDHALITQTLLFLAIITGLWLTEAIVSRQPWKGKWRHSSVNGLFILTALPIQMVMTVFLSLMSLWTVSNQWGLIYFVPYHTNVWVRYISLFFMLDLLDYVYHRTMHRVGGFWKFHMVHHSDRKLDVSTTVREHPGETFIRNCFLIFWVFLCGAPWGVLVLRQTAQTIFNLAAHTTMRLSPFAEKMLGWLFVTPNQHQVHHHFEQPYTNRNYGDVFCIWDRMFGTFSELPAQDMVFGLDTHMDYDGSFIAAAKMPFKNVQKK